MTPRLLAEAEAELAEAVLYYEDRRDGLGCRLHANVDIAIGQVGNKSPRLEARHR